MKHKIIGKKSIQGIEWQLKVELLAENTTETEALIKTEMVKATDAQEELVNNYLLFNLGIGNYSVVKIIQRSRNVFALLVAII